MKPKRKSDLDYLEATSLAEVIDALKSLKDDPELRQAMARNGLVRAKETQPEMMVSRWTDFLIEVAVPRYKKWCSMPAWQQQIFFKTRESSFALRPSYYYLRSQVLKLIN